MVRRGLARSRAAAAEAIRGGRVLVGGFPAEKVTRLVAEAEPIEIAGPAARFVSRGGVKLEAALDGFGIDVTGGRCLDVGASSGGFTDCLLQRGAAAVIAVDVGVGQLAWSLREDEKVDVRERTDIRDLEPLEGIDLVCADLSFISLRSVIERLARPQAPIVALVKPQFEVGRRKVGKGGIVRDPALHVEAIVGVVEAATKAGMRCSAGMPSPIAGAKGNREFFVLLEAPTGQGPISVTTSGSVPTRSREKGHAR